jgi:sulfite reductase (ferredoxin)
MGGRCDSQGARFGCPIGQVPAKALPGFISEVATDFSQHRIHGEAFSDYFGRVGQGHFADILHQYQAVPRFEDRPDFYQDFGSNEPFSLAGRGVGECGSGVFEVIREDLAAAGSAIEPFEILLPVCRALLIRAELTQESIPFQKV